VPRWSWLLIGAALGAHCGAPRGAASRSGADVTGGAAAGGARIRSNILRGDYAGSDSCARCHAEIHAAWRNSPMHLMTRVPAGEAVSIHTPFGGGDGAAPATFRFKDDTARLYERDGGDIVARVATKMKLKRAEVEALLNGA